MKGEKLEDIEENGFFQMNGREESREWSSFDNSIISNRHGPNKSVFKE